MDYMRQKHPLINSQFDPISACMHVHGLSEGILNIIWII